MGIIWALITAVCWGSIVLVSEKLGGDFHSQTFGMTLGALLFSLVAFFIVQPDLNMAVFAIGVISGIFWVIGQRNQFASVDYLGVSKIVPLSTGMQLFGTTLFGVLVFHEWKTTTEIMIGLAAIVAIVAGALLTSRRSKKANEKENQNFKKGITILLISTVGYVTYVVLIRWFEINGWEAILPQAIGMFIGALVMSFKHKPFNKYSMRNILTGLIWSTGNLTLLLALPLIGIATSFSLSQTGIIISTLGGIFILGEKRSKKEVIWVISGCVLIILGGVMLGFTKT
ncbi:GRP family sugar transporter [Fictibacillus phosphorivorans]|uniref:GRP family sugar transporter n=1 Tax=Fictibacillus phosphorivorans TaxID=1221500 RepID=UPI00203F78AB|nr:GRP family sugar transporter [Fictibacillus phosphorivorans]MCM3716946.1 GRP family sugar transporter [Fictibacillus phosphorivorans]MCM3774505.1 GRP family sugar transporter [Fictibacillus phosphorivorans]